MNTPADKTAKRVSSEEWFTRYDGVEFVKPVRVEPRRRALQQMLAPADRIAVRA